MLGLAFIESPERGIWDVVMPTSTPSLFSKNFAAKAIIFVLEKGTLLIFKIHIIWILH
jgi:hypothetical protein